MQVLRRLFAARPNTILTLSTPALLPIHAIRSFSRIGFRAALEMETVDTSKRLGRLRELMKEKEVDVYSMA